MQLELSSFKFVTSAEWQALAALEQGMRNHEFVPLPLVARLARLRTAGMFRLLGNLMKYKLVAYESKAYQGYRLTFLGCDYLAIHTLMGRGVIDSVGPRIGVGKEADVHVCRKGDHTLALKIHRLGRTSFRAVKTRRGYIRKGQAAHGWLYLSKLSALREYNYLTVLKSAEFPTPTPIDHNRHCVLMSFVDGVLLNKVRHLDDPESVWDTLMGLIVQLAQAGIVHGDFNEFNVILGSDGKLTLIGEKDIIFTHDDYYLLDFPQIVNVAHPNAEELFDRDVESVRALFERKFNYIVDEVPSFKDIVTEESIADARARKHLIELNDHQDLSDVINGAPESYAQADSKVTCSDSDESEPLSTSGFFARDYGSGVSDNYPDDYSYISSPMLSRE